MIKDPDTGKRVSRPNGEGEWQTALVPELAIIDDEVFESARVRRAGRALTPPGQQRRPRHLLTGLLRCGSCGSGLSASGRDKSGRVRVRCSAAKESGSCPDPKTFYLATIEEAVISGLKAEMQHPAVMAEYVRTYYEERKRLAATAIAERGKLELRAAKIEFDIERVVAAIADGTGDLKVLGPMTFALSAERERAAAELAEAPELPKVIALHPAALRRYEEQLERLQECLGDCVRTGDSEAAYALRDLVETVTVSRDASRPGAVVVEIAGRLNSLLDEKAYPNRVRGVWGQMVAEEGLEPPTPGL